MVAARCLDLRRLHLNCGAVPCSYSKTYVHYARTPSRRRSFSGLSPSDLRRHQSVFFNSHSYSFNFSVSTPILSFLISGSFFESHTRVATDQPHITRLTRRPRYTPYGPWCLSGGTWREAYKTIAPSLTTKYPHHSALLFLFRVRLAASFTFQWRADLKFDRLCSHPQLLSTLVETAPSTSGYFAFFFHSDLFRIF